jgi:hypothetical protein
VEVAEEEVAVFQPKIRKLSKKMLLVAATDALDEPAAGETEKASKVTKEKKAKVVKEKVVKEKEVKKPKVIIIESDDED